MATSAPTLAPAAETPAVTVLRVLTGRLAGAEHRLHAGRFVRIGHGFDHDIVLRDPSTRGLSVDLLLGDGVARLKVNAGTVGLFGRPLAAGEEATLPPYVPATLGAFTVAMGDAGSGRWEDAARLSTALGESAVPGDVDDAAPAARRAAVGQRIATRLSPLTDRLAAERRLPLAAALGGLLLLAGALATPVVRWVNLELRGPQGQGAVLAAAGFHDLKVTDTPSGPLISGVVRDDAALERLRQVVAERIGHATITVDTMQGLAAAATDVLHAQGVDGEVKPARGRGVLVTAEYLPVDRQEELVRSIRRDVPQILSVVFAADAARGDKDLQYFFSGGPYGLATFVDGDPSYLTTADGTRWFEGAQVPTGHRIASIGHGRVTFERDGRTEELVLGAAPPPAPAVTPLGGNGATR